jgi:hypothetical protein
MESAAGQPPLKLHVSVQTSYWEWCPCEDVDKKKRRQRMQQIITKLYAVELIPDLRVRPEACVVHILGTSELGDGEC